MSADRLRIVRRVSPEVFARVGPKGGSLAAPATVVVPVALDGGVLTLFTFPIGTAVKVDQAEAGLRDALASRGASVDRIETHDVDRVQITVAQALADLEARLHTLEAPA